MEKSIKHELYSLRLSDLPLRNVETRLHRLKRILKQELVEKGIRFDFHLWVSDDWFCPDGVPGFALPFYLFNTQLMKIEKSEIGFVEGTSEKQILKLMRHELGHCIDNAYRLRKNRERQRVFGSSKVEYPDYYTPKKYAQGYVHYLGDNYAQSHPDEDFAETFAVWLDPQSDWKSRYASKKAMAKLDYMDQLMRSLRNKRPLLKNKFRVDPIEKLRLTLREHYQLKKSRLKINRLDRIDRELRSLQSRDQGPGQKELLSVYLRQERKNLCRSLSQRSGSYVYQINYVINKTIERAERMKIISTKEQLHSQAPLLVERNYRYLKEKQKLRFYL